MEEGGGEGGGRRMRANNTNLMTCKRISMRNIQFFSQSTFSFEGDDMSWSCRHCEKTVSRKDNMQRHMNNRHSNHSYFVPFNAIAYSTETCQRFQLETSFHLHGGRDDRIRQDCLGPIAVETG